MKILILGGTIFIGRHFVKTALNSGCEVTLFNRGRQKGDLFPGVEYLVGDRHTDLRGLMNRQWDVVVDTSGYIPKVVHASASLLQQSVALYVYISTTSVYEKFDSATDENAALKQISDDDLGKAETLNIGDSPTAMTYGDDYGPLKARCENVVKALFPDRFLVIRPGVVAGPYDYTNRLAYWLNTIAKGGECLAPDGPSTPIRFIDARDLAEWTLRLIEDKASGVFHAMGEQDLSFGQFLSSCCAVTNSNTKFVWADEKFLLDQKVSPWSDLPLWLPKNLHGFLQLKDNKAIAAGLTYRPLDNIVSDTFAWLNTNDPQFKINTGLDQKREKALLSTWRQQLNA